MNNIHILGGNPVCGSMRTQGSKNAVLPMMAASVLHKGITILENVPMIQDVFCMMEILRHLGASVQLEGNRMYIDASDLRTCQIPTEHVCKMRSSIMILGPLLARLHEAETSYPGGCAIGARPVDYHVHLLQDLGIQVTEKDGCIRAKAKRYAGTALSLAFPSVGATENAIMAAVGASDETVIRGCAREPEIIELCRFLAAMGIETVGAGTSVIRVKGQQSLRDPHYTVCGDRIAAGTYLAAAAVTGGQVMLNHVPVMYMQSTLEAFCQAGCQIQTDDDRVWLQAPRRLRAIPGLKTEVYPGFPTDMQSILLAMQCCSLGESTMEETIFENRLASAAELQKMGASIQVKDNCVWITGQETLKGTRVTARDLRGGAALVIAGLAASGETVVTDCDHIDRGYEDMVVQLGQLGVQIWRER